MSKRVADLLVDTLQLVMPPSPLIASEAVIGVAVYSTRALPQGKGHDVWEMVVENISWQDQVGSSARHSDNCAPGCFLPARHGSGFAAAGLSLPRNRPPSHHHEVATPITANRDWRTSSEDGYAFERQSNGKRT
jgi:hypothetical protein